MRAVNTGRVFRRSSVADPPVAVEAHGSTIRDATGREYLDAAGGAIVVNIGHGRARDRPGHGRAGRPARLRPWQRVHDRAARGVRGAGRAATCRSTTRRSTRCRAARRRSRPRSSSPGPITSRAASPTAGSSTPGGGATTGTRSGRSTCPAASRSAGRTRAGSAASATSPRPIRTAPACPARTPWARPPSSRRSSTRPSRRPSPGPSPPSSPSRSSARRWPPSRRPTATGRPSPRSAAGTASC